MINCVIIFRVFSTKERGSEFVGERFDFSRELYSKEAVMKAAYTFIDDFYLHLDCDENAYLVEIEAREGKKELNAKTFLNEVLIQETRRIVDERTKDIREMIYARAMASTVIEEHPLEEPKEAEDAERILMDWFEENE